MDSEGSARSIVGLPFDGRSIDSFLNEFEGLRKNALTYDEFCAICTSVFEGEEIRTNEWRVRRIFDAFDSDSDGVLQGDEWKLFYEWIRSVMKPVNALIIVDVQNDFIDGSLALRNCECGHDGADVIKPINRLIKEGDWDKIVYSLDWHPENHISFLENLHLRELHPDSKVSKENAKPFNTVIFSEPYVEQKLWPKHCVENTWGAELHKDLTIAASSEQVRKGQDPEKDAYSVFAGKNLDGSIELKTILSKIGATHLYVCGLAYDICVSATCLDGLRLGYSLAVVEDCCRGTDIEGIERTKALIVEKGGLVMQSEDVLSLVSKTKRSLVMAHRLAEAFSSCASAEDVVQSSV